jgi:hypothetical protein
VSLPLQSVINTIIDAAIEAAQNIDTINDYLKSAADAANAGDLDKANEHGDVVEAATKNVVEIESKIAPSDIEAYKTEVSKHVKK